MNNKKVGILTFSYSSNPGSVLQAYALQRVLSDQLMCDAHIINYHKEEAGKPKLGKNVFYGPLRNWTPKNIVKWIARIMEYPSRMRPYKRFFKKYYDGYPTKRCLREELGSLESIYDKFVVGSDQVWNFNSGNVDETFLLDFVKDDSKKVSYAASFGNSEIPADKREVASELLSKFHSISVRESSGIDIVLELTKRSATLVLDPSLLLEKEQYLSMSKPPKQKNYVLLYLREECKELEAVARSFADSKGLEFVKILKHRKCLKNGTPGGAISPHEWLGYMSNSSYVFTNSFHGICFSIIFERQFFVDLLRANRSETNPRMQSVLALFGLDTRLISGNPNEIENIDYEMVNLRKAEMQKESLEYLRRSIEQEEL